LIFFLLMRSTENSTRAMSLWRSQPLRHRLAARGRRPERKARRARTRAKSQWPQRAHAPGLFSTAPESRAIRSELLVTISRMAKETCTGASHETWVVGINKAAFLMPKKSWNVVNRCCPSTPSCAGIAAPLYRRITIGLQAKLPKNVTNEIVRRLIFYFEVGDLFGRFKEDHRHADSFGRY